MMTGLMIITSLLIATFPLPASATLYNKIYDRTGTLKARLSWWHIFYIYFDYHFEAFKPVSGSSTGSKVRLSGYVYWDSALPSTHIRVGLAMWWKNQWWIFVWWTRATNWEPGQGAFEVNRYARDGYFSVWGEMVETGYQDHTYGAEIFLEIIYLTLVGTDSHFFEIEL